MKTVHIIVILLATIPMKLAVLAQNIFLNTNGVHIGRGYKNGLASIEKYPQQEIKTNYSLANGLTYSTHYNAAKIVSVVGNSDLTRKFRLAETNMKPNKAYARITLFTHEQATGDLGSARGDTINFKKK